MQFKTRPNLPRARIEIIPMIDTMFFLLVFFMLSSLALTKLNGLPVNLPPAGTAPRQAPTELTLSIDKDGNLSLNRAPVTLAELQGALLQKAGARADLSAATLIINADEQVRHGLVVRCMDAAREIGVTHFAIATAPETQNLAARP